MVPRDLLPYILWQDDSGQTRILRANVTETETIDLESEVTEHPVETGANITDHIRKSPDKVSVDLFFTDAVTRTDTFEHTTGKSPHILKVPEPPPFSLTTLTSTSNLLAAGLNALTPKKSFTAYSYDAPDKPRRIEAFEILSELRDKGTLVTVRTSTALFEEMAIETMSFTRSNETGDGVKISLGLKKVRFVTSDLTLAVPLPKEPRAQKKFDNGLKPGAFDVPRPKVSALAESTNGFGLTSAGTGIR